MGSLLLLLTFAPNRRRSRDELIDLLWPDATPEAGASNLRYIVHLLRRNLGGGDPSPVLTERGWVALNPAHSWEVDLDRFCQLAESDDAAAWEEAAALYRSEPLVEHRYEDWAEPIRESVRRTWKDVCLRLARLSLARHDAKAAVRWYERVLAGDPLDEELVQLLLEVLLEQDRNTEALRLYKQFERRLKDELDVEPMPATRALLEELKHERLTTADFPSLRQQDAGHPSIIVPSYPLSTADPLVGREAELATILDALPSTAGLTDGASSSPSAPRLVLVAAEAGMGKTRLLAEAAEQVRVAGVLTLAGGCYEQEGGLPYGPIHDAFLDYVQSQPEPILERQLGDALADLVRIIPELRGCAPTRQEPGSDDPESGRLRLFTSMAAALQRIARDVPLLVVLDDLHWADDATLQLLHFLLRQPRLERVVLLASYRSDEVPRDASVDRFISSAQVARWTRRIDLKPLSDTDFARILEQRLAGRCAESLIRTLHERSEGNPFFAVEMLRLLRQEGRLEISDHGWRLATDAVLDVPSAVRDAVARRLRHLGPDEREALTWGAVLGREFAYAPLEALWKGDERSLLGALDVAAEVHLITETGDGYAFQHPLLWEVIYRRAPAPRRARLHERVALVLELVYGEQSERHAAELANHFLAAGRVHADRAIHYLVLAGDHAEHAFAHEEAEQYYRQARELVRQVGDTTGLAEVSARLGSVFRSLARLDEAIEILEEAVRIYESTGDLEAEGRVVAELGWAYYYAGRNKEGLKRVQLVRHRLEGRDASRCLVLLYGVLARLSGEVEGPAAELEIAEREGELARALGDSNLLASALKGRGYALSRLGRPAEGIEALEEAIDLSQRSGNLRMLAASYHYMRFAYYQLGNLGAAMRYGALAVETAERRGGWEQLVAPPGLLAQHMQMAVHAGDWAEARSYGERLLSALRSSDDASEATVDRGYFGKLIIGTLDLYEGEWERAAQHLDKSAAIAERLDDMRTVRAARSRLAEKELLVGRPADAIACLQPSLELSGSDEDAGLQTMLAWALSELGDQTKAEEHINRALAHSRLRPPYFIDAQRIQGLIMARQGRSGEAERLWSDAATRAHDMPCLYGEARILYELGLLHCQRSEPDRARERLEEALVIFERLTAQPYIERTEQALNALTHLH